MGRDMGRDMGKDMGEGELSDSAQFHYVTSKIFW